jgi:hypothetical protein
MMFILLRKVKSEAWRVAARLHGHQDKSKLDCVQFNFSTMPIDFRVMTGQHAGHA